MFNFSKTKLKENITFENIQAVSNFIFIKTFVLKKLRINFTRLCNKCAISLYFDAKLIYTGEASLNFRSVKAIKSLFVILLIISENSIILVIGIWFIEMNYSIHPVKNQPIKQFIYISVESKY